MFCDLSPVISSFLDAWISCFLVSGTFPSLACTCPIAGLARTTHAVACRSKRNTMRLCWCVSVWPCARNHLTPDRDGGSVRALIGSIRAYSNDVWSPDGDMRATNSVSFYVFCPNCALAVFSRFSADDTRIGRPGSPHRFIACRARVPAGGSAVRQGGGFQLRPRGKQYICTVRYMQQ